MQTHSSIWISEGFEKSMVAHPTPDPHDPLAKVRVPTIFHEITGNLIRVMLLIKFIVK